MSGTKKKNTSISLTFLALFFFVFAVVMGGNVFASELNAKSKKGGADKTIKAEQANELIEPPEGEAPSVEAYEIEQGEPVFKDTGEEPEMLRPNHPPIDQIPPMPMPEPQERDEQGVSMQPEAAVYYNAITGETVEIPLDRSEALGGFGQVEGYGGVDGGGGIERLPATFYNMSQISNTEDHPWRMNVKLVMKFGSSWYVASGTMMDAETVQTAGHCVYDYGGAGWADEIWVYPGYDGNDWNVPPPDTVGAYGWGRGTYFSSLTGWTGSGNTDYDLGMIRITRGVGMLTGWFGSAYGGDCSWHTSTTYSNSSYPAENCPISGLHNGLDMYYWYGYFDACPGNQLQLNTGGGNCFDTVWGGMSGSGAYYIVSDSRYVHAVCSTSNRTTRGYYCRMYESWVDYMYDTFIPGSRGTTFDLQALDVNAGPAIIKAGTQTTLLNHLGTNPTNGSDSDAYYFNVYLSTNSDISTADTYLSRQGYSWSFGAMNSVRVNMGQVTIPENTPAGDYWLGLVYDTATDGDSSNNDTDGWDAVPIAVTAETNPPTGSLVINSGAIYATSPSVNLTLSASDTGSGVADMHIGNSGGTWDPWEPYTTSKAWSLIPGDGSKSVWVQYRDNAGNISSQYGDGIILDTTAPTGSIMINGGAANTNSLIVTLNLSASDATSGMSQMRFSNNSSIWSPWETYSTTKSGWDLSTYGGSSSPGTKTTYVQYRDAAGNVSLTYRYRIDYVELPACEGNFDGDHDVDGSDLAVFAADFGRTDCATGSKCEGDFDRDGDVDGSDLAVFAADFGRTDCP